MHAQLPRVARYLSFLPSPGDEKDVFYFSFSANALSMLGNVPLLP